jgi:hypothetical protein
MRSHQLFTPFLIPLLLAASLTATGCASYTVPGRAANLEAFGLTADAKSALTDSTIQSSLSRKPLASFPAAIAVARVQAPRYRSYTANSYGDGAYSIVTTRDIEEPAQMERLSKLHLVNGVAPIGRLILPTQLKSDMELRQAAAQLHADMLLIYTLDTTFQSDEVAAPLTIITLGLAPNHKLRVVSTASALLMDTRNGYLYGVAEFTDVRKNLSSAWTSDSAVDETRRDAERAAFTGLVGELEKTWASVVRQYAGVYQTK